MNHSSAVTSGKSQTGTVFDALRADILACRLRPSTKLKINELTGRFGVSLGAVREALSRLVAEGLVVAEAQRGFQVAPVSAADLIALTETRIDIEALALRKSIAKGDLQWESAVVGAFHLMSRTPLREESDPTRSSDAWMEVHNGFHHALTAGCDNVWLLRVRDMLYAQSERYRRLSVPAAQQDRDLNGEHKAIMDAALARDADRAVQMLTQHLNATTQILMDAFKTPSAAA